MRHHAQPGLMHRLEEYPREVAVPIVAVEEQLRGWLASIRKTSDPQRQVFPSLRLLKLIDFYQFWRIVPFDEPAATAFAQLREQRVRIGTQDLKIASCALVQDAMLLSANLRDFEQVPGLTCESWL